MKIFAALVIAIGLLVLVSLVFNSDDTDNSASIPTETKAVATSPNNSPVLEDIKESENLSTAEKEKLASSTEQKFEALPAPRDVVKNEAASDIADDTPNKTEEPVHQDRVAVFENEEKDTYWAEPVEQQLMSLFEEEGINANMQSMDCRTTLCKIYLSNVSGDDLNILRQKISDELSDKIADPTLELYEDGSMVMYLTRENFTGTGG